MLEENFTLFNLSHENYQFPFISNDDDYFPLTQAGINPLWFPVTDDVGASYPFY